jgi:hypothetical protein
LEARKDILSNAGIRVCECGMLDSESNQAARDRWMQLMGNAFSEAALPAEAEQFLRTFLEQMSTFMINDGGFEA